ncbi:MAG TPA: aromatic amino acid transport family protein [Candidatus Paceibacterota bacterium]|nr:aromatic amino acid transport family protein [Candidatus Paceibacterota bacterium]
MTFLGKNRKFWAAVAALVGGTVGVGIFGMPFAFAKAGFWIGAAFLIPIALATLLVNLMYGEVILRTHDKHQLMGYAGRYLGPFFKGIVFFSATLTGYAALLAYIIIAGDFLNSIFSQFFYGSLTMYSICFFIVASLLVLRGLKLVSWIELVLMGFFFVIIGLFFVTGFSHIDLHNFLGQTREYAALPYGVLLFAFGGLMAVPIQRQILAAQERNMRRAIVYAVGITAALYAVFAITVVGIAGPVTSPDAVSGLFPFLGERVVVLASVFGIFAVSTSFLMLGSALVDMFHFDFGVRRFPAWLLAVIPPLALFLLGLRGFVDVISFTGGVALGLEQLVIVLLYARAKRRGDRIPEYSLNIPRWLLYVIMAVFLAGVSYYLVAR